MKIVVRMGVAGNGAPAFVIAGQSRELERPFGATWDSDRFLWMYPAYYPAAKKVLSDFAVLERQGEVEYSEPVQQYIKQLDEIERRYAEQELPNGFSFVTPPFEHQLSGLCHVYYFLRAALFYDPGLGKSKIAIDLIRLLHRLGQREPTVILGPLVTVKNWGKEIDRHSGGELRWGALLGTKKQKTAVVERAAAGEFDVLLLTYDTGRNFVDSLVKSVPYKTVIADESHLIAKWTSSRTKAAYEIGQKAVRKVIMTGTPTLGSPLDLYGQFRFLANAFMPEPYHLYQKRFVEYVAPPLHGIVGYKNLDILNARTQFVSSRKTKDECLDLPDRTIIDIEYELSRHQTVIYNQFVAEMKISVEDLVRQLAVERPTADPAKPSLVVLDQLPPDTELPHRAALLNKLLQISSGFLIKNNTDNKLCDSSPPGPCQHLATCVSNNIRPYTPRCKVQPTAIPDTVTVFDENPKLEALLELLDTILADPAHKVIVWCYYRHELDFVEEAIKGLGVGYVRVDGSTGGRIQGLVDQFNEDPSLRVYLAQVSTGVGITINAATYMVYYSLTYSLGAYLQSLDRNYRIGQSKKVTTYRLLGKQTVEPAVARLLDNKVDVDQVLTQKLSCVVCPRFMVCFAEDIKLFDEGCIYQRDMIRPVAKATLIGDL